MRSGTALRAGAGTAADDDGDEAGAPLDQAGEAREPAVVGQRASRRPAGGRTGRAARASASARRPCTRARPRCRRCRAIASWRPRTRTGSKRSGDRGSGEHDGAAAARHRAAYRVGDVEAGAALFAEPAHHEQSVVDAEPDAEHDHDVQRVERHVGDRRDDAERDHRRRTRRRTRSPAACRPRRCRRTRSPSRRARSATR